MSEQGYINLAKKVLSEGEYRADRTGVGIYSLFGEQVKYDLTEGFPLLTSKKVYFKTKCGYGTSGLTPKVT